MKSDSSVSVWIADLKAGEADAAQRLWDRYFVRLLSLARRQLGVVACGGADEEDVAQSVFKSLCLGALRGKYSQVTDRDNLWALLVAMSAHKSRDVIRREQCAKRGGGKVLREAALASGPEPFGGIEDLIDREPTPEFAVQVAEQCERLLSRLKDIGRRTAELKLQGFSNQEIAANMGCGLRTVERRLAAVRREWIAFC